MVSHVAIAAPGPVSARISSLTTLDIQEAIRRFTVTSSTVMWCIAAISKLSSRAQSLCMLKHNETVNILESPPAALPSVERSGQALLQELQKSAATLTDLSDEAVQWDLRRWWSLILTLVTQSNEFLVST